MASVTNRREKDVQQVKRTCSGLNLTMEKDKGNKRRAGLFYLPSPVHSWKCDHIFETEEGYQHIVDTTSFGAA